MSESQLIFIEGNKLPSVEDIRNEASNRSYNIKIDDWDVDTVEEVSGYWPCVTSGEKSGIEFFISPIDKEELAELGISEESVIGKTHCIDLAYRDELEYKTAAIFSAIFCKLCNGVSYDENQELTISTKNAVRWAKKVSKKGFNSKNTKRSGDLWVEASGKDIILENDLHQLAGKELLHINYMGVWAGGLSLHIEGGFRIYASAWRLHKKENIFDVTRYRRSRINELRYIEGIDDPLNPTEIEESELIRFEESNDHAISLDSDDADNAMTVLAKWPDKVFLNAVEWDRVNKISIRIQETDDLIELFTIDRLDEIRFETPNGRTFILIPEETQAVAPISEA